MTRSHLALLAWTLLPLALSSATGCPAPLPAGQGGASYGGWPAQYGGAQPVASGGWLPVGVGGQAGAAGSYAWSSCLRACDNLARLGCPEDQVTCVGQCEIVTHDSRFTFDVDCRIRATTKAEAQACGIASCK